MIYLDHAATTPVRADVLAAMLPFFSDVFSNPSAGYSAARKSRRAIDQARSETAAALGAERNEIYFTSGGSESDSWALMGAAAADPEKKHIITSKIEHHAVLHSCKALEQQGYEVTYLGVDAFGRVSPDELSRALRPDTLLVSVMLANNEVGTIEPICRLAGIAHAAGALMHTDAVQAVGHIPVDVNDLGIDLLSLSAHKFGGPKGIGALYIRSGTRIDRLIYGGAQERNLRAGTENLPAIVGMGKALTVSVEEMLDAGPRIARMRDMLEAELLSIRGVRVNGNTSDRLPGHLHISADGAQTELLLMQLDMAGIAVSAGSACTSGSLLRSHVIEAMGLGRDNQANIRFTIGADNTEEEMAAAACAMRRILER